MRRKVSHLLIEDHDVTELGDRALQTQTSGNPNSSSRSGTGPATGTNATTCTPSPAHVELMLKATVSYEICVWGSSN